MARVRMLAFPFTLRGLWSKLLNLCAPELPPQITVAHTCPIGFQIFLRNLTNGLGTLVKFSSDQNRQSSDFHLVGVDLLRRENHLEAMPCTQYMANKCAAPSVHAGLHCPPAGGSPAAVSRFGCMGSHPRSHEAPLFSEI